MAGFSPEWLALREPADVAARSRRVLGACRQAFSNRPELVICDMGAGTGASVRALAHLLPARQGWLLIDHDAANLAAAQKTLSGWADDAQIADGVAQLRRGDSAIDVHVLTHDFAAQPACWPNGTGLVTASALLDLASAAWIETFVAALAQRHLPLLAMLTVDGVMKATPSQELDDAVFSAFRAHQGRDKGFGPAAGPEAASHLERTLLNAGYEFEGGDSPWLIDKSQSALMHALLAGIADAARETGEIDAGDLERWLRHGAAHTEQLIIGHRDVFAWPGEQLNA